MRPLPTIAVLSNSPALLAVLGATLRREHRWRVREFATVEALHAYLRIAQVAVLVTDYHLDNSSAADLATDIRSDATLMVNGVQIVALTREITDELRRRSLDAGIDEVIAKPMSPLYLEERIRARLDKGTTPHLTTNAGYRGPERRERLEVEDRRRDMSERRADNVISFVTHRTERDNRRDPHHPA